MSKPRSIHPKPQPMGPRRGVCPIVRRTRRPRPGLDPGRQVAMDEPTYDTEDWHEPIELPYRYSFSVVIVATNESPVLRAACQICRHCGAVYVDQGFEEIAVQFARAREGGQPDG